MAKNLYHAWAQGPPICLRRLAQRKIVNLRYIVFGSVDLGDHSFIHASGCTIVPFRIDKDFFSIDAYIIYMPDNIQGLPFVVLGRNWL